MADILISIRPNWIQKIFDGEKTVEIRKTRPKIEPPFRCYIYCTKPMYEYEDILLTEEPASFMFGGGMVVGEFVCDSITKYLTGQSFSESRICFSLRILGCLTENEVWEYAAGKDIFGWHISDLCVYERPKPLSDFKRWDKTGELATIERLRRPPQSWCYVEGGLTG